MNKGDKVLLSTVKGHPGSEFHVADVHAGGSYTLHAVDDATPRPFLVRIQEKGLLALRRGETALAFLNPQVVYLRLAS